MARVLFPLLTAAGFSVFPAPAYLEQAVSGTAASSGSIRLLFHLNEVSGTTANDAGKYANNGTLTNFPVSPWTATALAFDGTNDYVNVPDASSLDLTTGLTLEAWVSVSTLGGVTPQAVLSKWDQVDGRRSYLLRVDSLTGKVEFLLSADGTESVLQLFTLTSAGTLTAATFTHVAATYDGTTMKIFVNGVQDGNTLAGPASIFSSPAPVRVGARGDATQTPEQFFGGTIDEPRILDYARADFGQNHVYHFNESGTTPPGDSGGYNHAASLNNSPTYTSTGARFGNALSYNGSNTYAQALYLGPDVLTTALTLEAWIHPTVVTGQQRIVSSESPPNVFYGLRLNGANVELRLRTGGTTTILTSTGTVSAGALTHIAGTWDGSTMRIFIDGTQDPSTAAKSGTIAAGKEIRIGSGRESGQAPIDTFNGEIDELRILNSARTGFNPGAVVNEVALSPPSGNQWIEISNGGGATVNLAGWVFKNTSDNRTYTVPSSGTRTISPGAFVVIELGIGIDTASTYFTGNDSTCLLSCLNNGDLSAAGDTLSVYPNSTITSANIIDYVAWGTAPASSADGLAAGLWARGTFVGVAPTAQSVGLLGDGNDEEGWKDWGGLTPTSKGSSNVGATAAGLVDLRAEADGEGVLVSWETAFEPGNLGFYLYRAADGKGPFVRVNSRLFLARVGAPFGDRHAFRDPAGREGWWYQLEDVSTAAVATRHPAVRARPQNPGESSAHSSDPYEAVRPGQRRSTKASHPESSSVPGRTLTDHVNLSIPAEGIYRVELHQVAALLGPRGRARPTLVLTDHGVPVPFRVRPASAGRAPSLEFFGRGLEAKYSKPRVYQVYRERTTLRARPMASRSAPVSSGVAPAETATGAIRYEENSIYFVSSTEDDLFFWDLVFNERGPTSFRFESEALPGLTRLRGDLLGVTEAPSVPRNHHVRIRLNGVPVHEGFFKDTESHRFDAAIPPGVLAESNVIEFAAAGDSGSPTDVFLVNWFEVEAPRRLEARGDRLFFEADASTPVRVSGFSGQGIEIFDLTDPTEPVEITGFRVEDEGGGRYAATFQDSDGPAGPRRYLAVGEGGVGAPSIRMPPPERNLRERSNRGDYLVVTTPEFHPALEPLLDLRREEGFEPRVVDAEAIYDQFGAGNKSPNAIRDFVSEAARSWRIPPRYLLLAGGASFDPRDYLGTGWADHVPTRLFFTRKYHYEAADDGYFVRSLPPGAPPIAVGRLAAQSGEEMAAAVGKILEYESLQADHPQGRALFIADDRNARNGLPDPTFEAASDSLAGGLSEAGVVIRRLSLRESGDPRAALFSALAEGVDLVNFLGHGGPQTWTSAKVLTVADSPALPNGPGSYFTVLSLTCFDGIFTYPYGDSLAWSLVKAEGRGAVAAYAPSTILDPGPHAELDRLLLEGAHRGGARRLGDITREAESGISSAAPGSLDMVDSYNLIGDPALRLRWSDR